MGCVNGVTIYEAKAGKTKALDLYQLRMYVDGCALDNKPVDEAILIARYHPPEVRELLDILNGLSAPDDRPYNFRLVTWDEGGHLRATERVTEAREKCAMVAHFSPARHTNPIVCAPELYEPRMRRTT